MWTRRDLSKEPIRFRHCQYAHMFSKVEAHFISGTYTA